MAKIGIWGLANGRGSGIGAKLAGHLHKSGNSIVAIARSWDGKNIDNAEKIEIDFQKNISSKEASHKLGVVDALVVTAGFGIADPIWAISGDHISSMVWTNLHLPALIVQSAIHCTRHIVLTASIAGVRQREGSSIYAGTKAGVIAMADSMRRELPDHFIQTISFDNVNAVGTEKVMSAYEFLLKTPGNFDIHMSR